MRFSARFQSFLPAIVFLLIAIMLFATNAFPSLYGDEYGSLFDAYNLSGNIHAIGYFLQLRIWNSISNADAFLRILSLFWFLLSVYWLKKWLDFESISKDVQTWTVWLFLLNPFLWVYALQIRFYAFFLAASILFIWRLRLWRRIQTRRNLALFVVSVGLLLTSHLFGYLVAAIGLFSVFWDSLSVRRRWIFVSILSVGLILFFFPPVHSVLVRLVYRASNPYAPIPAGNDVRGISLGMIAKIPFTFYFFTLGERVYPLWWWLSIPALLIAGMAFGLGLWHLRHLSALAPLTVAMLLSVPFMYLVLDPLAPPGLQGAAPRYMIFVAPYLMLVLAVGARQWKFMPYALIVLSLTGLFCTAWPKWSYEQNGDTMDWKTYLNTAIGNSQQSCVVMDGRSEGSVLRYAPLGTKIVRGDLNQCLGFSRIVLVSDDFRLFQTRSFDEMEALLLKSSYRLVSNYVLFPAQITAFEQSPQGNRGQIFPSRLDLPEQDLHFPIVVSINGWKIEGFMRLDKQRPLIETFVPTGSNGNVWLLSNYRVDRPVPAGTPVFSLQYETISGVQKEIILKAEEETSNWNGACTSCSQIANWTKLIHLIGAYSYPGAYSQYEAKIWGIQILLEDQAPGSALKISYLLPTGTGYFWGLYSNGK